MKDPGAEDWDKSYDHLVKGDQRREESKYDELNEELKEGFIGDLCKSSLKNNPNENKEDIFPMPEMDEDRSRCKTALINGGMRSTFEESKIINNVTPITPMINNMWNEENEGKRNWIIFYR